MTAFYGGRGFLGTAAPRAADQALVIELGMGLMLLVGAVLARRRQYRAHAVCQSAVVLMNLAVIVRTMVPSFRRQIVPALPGQLDGLYYLLAGAHGILGVVAELAALYVLMAAGTDILPNRLRLTEYKPWMRSLLALWWLVLLLGVATYLRWYVVPL